MSVYRASDLPGAGPLQESLRRQLQEIENHLSVIDPAIAEPWATVFVPGQSATAVSGVQPGFTTIPGLSVLAFLFDQSSTETIQFALVMPRDWREGTVVYPAVHWTRGGSLSGNAVWELRYARADVSEALVEATITLTAVAGGQLVHHRSEFAGLSLSDLLIQSTLICQLSRLGGGAGDTLSEDAALIGVALAYQKDSHGSGERVAKRL